MERSKKQRAAQYYVQQEVKGIIDHDIDTGDMERAFIAGAEWMKNKAIEALSSTLEDWVHGGDADCIIAGFEERLYDGL